jgi:hypothetical protein
MAHIIEHEGLGANAHFKKFLVKCTEFTGGEKPPESTFASKTELDECLNAKSKGTGSLEAECKRASEMRILRRRNEKPGRGCEI